jgi:hypothetical protein
MKPRLVSMSRYYNVGTEAFPCGIQHVLFGDHHNQSFRPSSHITHRREGQNMPAFSANLGGCQYEYRAIAHLIIAQRA